MSIEMDEVDTIISKHGADRRALISLLLDIQDKFYYLPQEALERVAEKVDVPSVQVFQVAKFYKAFSLTPRGKHKLTVCLGTACHVRGGKRLLEQVDRILNVETGGTTEDKLFTVEAVSCLACCALGPVMVIDGKYYGNLKASKLPKILDTYRTGSEASEVTEDA
jgi:NADH-quinone oxidoreductase subunit E